MIDRTRPTNSFRVIARSTLDMDQRAVPPVAAVQGRSDQQAILEFFRVYQHVVNGHVTPKGDSFFQPDKPVYQYSVHPSLISSYRAAGLDDGLTKPESKKKVISKLFSKDTALPERVYPDRILA